MSGLRNPFPGIRPFRGDEQQYFFGRDKQVAQISQLLLEEQHRFVCVVGVSGSGKSSLIRAGLIPKLQQEEQTWRFAICRPEDSPLQNLIRALEDPAVLGDTPIVDYIETNLESSALGLVESYQQSGISDPILLFIDQFEELFRFSEDSEQQDQKVQFVNLLINASNTTTVPIYVVLTMRSDYYGSTSKYLGLPEKINQGHFLVPRLSRKQYKQIITGPLSIGEEPYVRMAPNVVSRLLNNIQEDPDQLPVVQHLLMRMWDNASHRWTAVESDAEREITFQDYEEVKELGGALSTHADEILASLKAEDDGLPIHVKRIFQRLSRVTADGKRERNPAPYGLLQKLSGSTPTEFKSIINAFRQDGANFLMPPPNEPLNDDTQIDIAHESLMEKWDTLAHEWIPQEKHNQDLLQELERRTKDYQKKKGALLDKKSIKKYYSWIKFREFRHYKQGENTALVWANQYSESVRDIIRFLERSDRNIKRRRLLTRAVIVLAVVLVGFIIYQDGEKVIRELEIQYLDSRIIDLEEGITNRDSTITALEETLEEARKDVSLANLTIHNRDSLLNVEIDSIGKLHMMNNRAMASISQLERSLDATQDSLKIQIVDLNRNYSQLSEIYTDATFNYERDTARLLQRIKQGRSQIAQSEAQIRALELQYQQALNEVEAMNAKMDTKRNEDIQKYVTQLDLVKSFAISIAQSSRPFIESDSVLLIKPLDAMTLQSEYAQVTQLIKNTREIDYRKRVFIAYLGPSATPSFALVLDVKPVDPTAETTRNYLRRADGNDGTILGSSEYPWIVLPRQ
ncbi:MAG: AAA family ATPase [Bacteroidota bacterium]